MDDNELDRRLRQDCPYYQPWSSMPSLSTEDRIALGALVVLPVITALIGNIVFSWIVG